MKTQMSHSVPPPAVQALLDEAAWIRSLARRLARDASEADDLVQETLASALEHPPDRGQQRRAWLAVVVANAARALRRSRARREVRERAAARPEAQPSTAELVERAGLQRELVEAVLELDEPYRTVVLLRFYEGLTPRAIAARLGVPVATVRTRTARAVARLRMRLDDRFDGDRGAWLALVLPPPLAAIPPKYTQAPPVAAVPLSIPIAGGVLLNAKLAVAVAVVLALTALVLFRTSGMEPSSPPDMVVAGAPIGVAPNTPPSSQLRDVDTAHGRSAEAPQIASTKPAAKQAVPAASAPMLRGIVMDGDGRRLGGVAVGIERGEHDVSTLATSTVDGSFSAPFPAESGPLVAAGSAWSTVFSAQPMRGGPDAVVVLAPRLHLAGFVVDTTGALIAGAEMRLEMPADLRTRFSVDMDHSARIDQRTASDDAGRFEFDALPRLRGAELVVTSPGFDARRLPLEELVDPFTVVLNRPGQLAEVLQGIVVDVEGLPVDDATVAFGLETTRTQPDGRFTFRLDDPRSWNARMRVVPELVRAVRVGFLPGEWAAPVVGGKPTWPPGVTLRLGAEALTISGRVRGADGEPRAGLRVWALDSEVFGAGRRGPLVLENVLAGADERLWSFVETDAEGRFALHGLLARPYTLRAQDPATMQMVDEVGIDAGRTDVEMRLPADGLFLRVASVVRGHDGTPIAGVNIHPMCDVYRARFRGDVVSTSHDAVDGVTTDAEGRFTLERVPQALVYLRLDGAQILPLEYGRYAEGDPRFENAPVKELPRDHIEALDIRVDRRAHVQIELADPTAGDAFQLLDEQGRPIELSVFEGNNRQEGMQIDLLEGRSPVVSGSDRGRTLVLLKSGVEVDRRNVALDPKATTHVAW